HALVQPREGAAGLLLVEEADGGRGRRRGPAERPPGAGGPRPPAPGGGGAGPGRRGLPLPPPPPVTGAPPLLPQRGEPVAVTTVDRLLGREQGGDRLLTLADVVELGAHHPGQQAAAGGGRQENQRPHAGGG